ncbi:hypothetical protein D3C78_1762740 [compost metagenome]
MTGALVSGSMLGVDALLNHVLAMISTDQYSCILHNPQLFQLTDHLANMVIHITNRAIIIVDDTS